MLKNNHCGKSGCMCTHSDPCEFGWIWEIHYEETRVKSEGGYKVRAEPVEGVRFCPTCNPERAAIQRQSRDATELGESLRARSNANRIKSYENNESTKTRTL